jgi:hypothetical protein
MLGMADTGIVLDIYGELQQGMHGIFILTESWSVSPNQCGPVPVAEVSWGGLKAQYR